MAAEGGIVDDAPGGRALLRAACSSPTCRPDHVLAREEIFGPVQVRDPVRATRTRRWRSPTAPATGWWPRSGPATAARALRLARRLRAGQVYLNDYGAGGGVELPFGGVGRSGHGREKGFEALYGFTRLKTVAAWHGE